jgi:hypothetical protein
VDARIRQPGLMVTKFVTNGTGGRAEGRKDGHATRRGRVVGEPPGSSRCSTLVVKKYDTLQSRETLAVSHPQQRLETRPDAHEALTLCPYSGETVAACRHYRPVSEHGYFPEAAECRDTFTVPVSDRVRQRLCRRGVREAEASGLLPEAMPPSTPGLQEADIGLLGTRSNRASPPPRLVGTARWCTT